jgi:hypothetical protein
MCCYLIETSIVLILQETTICRTHGYKDLEETKLDRSSKDQHLSVLRFNENVEKGKFCGHDTVTEGLFVTKQTSNAGNSL